MRRALALVLALVASVCAAPATAAPATSSRYVYEVVRLHPKAWPHAYVRIRPGKSAPWAYVLVKPDDAGEYRAREAGWGSEPTHEIAMKVDLSGGARFLVGSDGPTSFHVNEKHWGVRRVRAGFRWALPDPADRTDVAVVGAREHFTRATLPSGPYGSLVLASPPCANGAGVWSLRKDHEPAAVLPSVCAIGAQPTWDETTSGGSWVLEGRVVGDSGWWPYRLMVLDFPKP